jgi:hypothetical protein
MTRRLQRGKVWIPTFEDMQEVIGASPAASVKFRSPLPSALLRSIGSYPVSL